MNWFTKVVSGRGTSGERGQSQLPPPPQKLQVSKQAGWRKSLAAIGLAAAAAAAAALLAPASASAQVATNAIALSNQVVTPYGTPAPNAAVRICLIGATGSPCSTAGVILYSDPNLSYVTSNPIATDQYGNYKVFVVAGAYMLQVTPAGAAGPTYTYYYIGTSVTAGTSGFPITLGSTAIASGSTTTALTGLSVNGVLLTTADGATTYLNGAGAYTTPAGGTFTALTGDATSTATGGATEVVGLLSHTLPSLSTGFLNWTGSAWAFSAAGSMVYPGVGIGNSTGSAWGTSYSSTNLIPANFISTLNQSTTGNAATATNISTSGTANQVWGMNSGATAQGWQTITGATQPSTYFFVNSASTYGGTPDGTENKPFLTVQAAFAAMTQAEPYAVVMAQGGTYTFAAFTWPSAPTHVVIYGNGSTWAVSSGTLTPTIPIDIYDLTQSGLIEFATGSVSSQVFDGSISGTVTIDGNVVFDHETITSAATISVLSGSKFVANGGNINGHVASAGGSLLVFKNNVIFDTPSYASNITCGTGDQLLMTGGDQLTNNGISPNIACTDGATSSAPNIIGDQVTMNVGAQFGSAVTWVSPTANFGSGGIISSTAIVNSSYPFFAATSPITLAQSASTGVITIACPSCGTGGSGTVTNVSVAAANNGVTLSIANPTTTPALTVGLGAITPTSVAASGAISGTTITASGGITSSGSTRGLTVLAGTAASGAAGSVVYASDATNGYGEINENNTGLSRICTVANGVCLASLGTMATQNANNVDITGGTGLFGTLGASVALAAVATTSATSSANVNPPPVQLIGQYWSGGASLDDNWEIQEILGTGANPTSELAFSHSGSSGATNVSFPSITDGTATLTGGVLSGATIAFPAWTQTTPTPSCQTGTPTTLTSTLRVSQEGKTAFVNFMITDTSNGTCAGAVYIPVPFTAESNSELACGSYNGVAVVSGIGGITLGTSEFTTTLSTGATWAGTGNNIICSGVVETR